MTSQDVNELFEGICRRPRMYFEPTATTRDLIFLLRGVCIGIAPPHGNCASDGFWEFLYRHFDREPPLPNQWPVGGFTAILFEEFGDKPLFDVCETMGGLFREWRERQTDEL